MQRKGERCGVHSHARNSMLAPPPRCIALKELKVSHYAALFRSFAVNRIVNPPSCSEVAQLSAAIETLPVQRA